MPNRHSRIADDISLACLAAVAAISLAPGIATATVFRLTASQIVIDQPAPLFTSNSISGFLTLDNAILPGQSFGSSAVTGLDLSFGGISGTLADVQAAIFPGPVQVFGTRSLDGKSLSVFDFRFGFPTTVAGCSFVCAGQIIINSPIGPNDPSNFIAIDDPNAAPSVISSFTPTFTAIPEPSSWTFMVIGLGMIGAGFRRRAGRHAA